MTIVIAIDGPAGSGKGTIAKKISSFYNFPHLDSGILYRTFAYLKTMKNIDTFDADCIASLIKDLSLEPTEDLSFNVLFESNNITEKLYYEEVGLLASSISKNEMIRSALLPLQHACIQSPGLIANGRDMGTKVFPNSVLKLYFIADLDIRAQRRFNQLIKNGSKPNLQDIRKFIKDRDEKDINRDISPLKAAKDAIIIDSSQLNIDSILDKILELYKITGT